MLWTQITRYSLARYEFSIRGPHASLQPHGQTDLRLTEQMCLFDCMLFPYLGDCCGPIVLFPLDCPSHLLGLDLCEESQGLSEARLRRANRDLPMGQARI